MRALSKMGQPLKEIAAYINKEMQGYEHEMLMEQAMEAYFEEKEKEVGYKRPSGDMFYGVSVGGAIGLPLMLLE